jgi:hypothetical protein
MSVCAEQTLHVGVAGNEPGYSHRTGMRVCLLCLPRNYLIDLDHALIVDIEARRAIRQAEVCEARTVIEHRGSFRPLSGAARRRHRPCHAWLAPPRALDRAAHPCVRQVRAPRRHLRAGLLLTTGEQSLTCPGKELWQYRRSFAEP